MIFCVAAPLVLDWQQMTQLQHTPEASRIYIHMTAACLPAKSHSPSLASLYVPSFSLLTQLPTDGGAAGDPSHLLTWEILRAALSSTSSLRIQLSIFVPSIFADWRCAQTSNGVNHGVHCYIKLYQLHSWRRGIILPAIISLSSPAFAHRKSTQYYCSKFSALNSVYSPQSLHGKNNWFSNMRKGKTKEC